MPAEGPSGIGSGITRPRSGSSARRTPPRTLKSRPRLTIAAPPRSSSAAGMSPPATARTTRARVRLADVKAEATLGGEPAHDQRVADRGEMLAADRERGLVLRAAAIERRRVLGRGPRVVVTAAAGRGGVADGQAFERARGVR